MNVLKVVENIFEHNDGVVFGKSNLRTGEENQTRLLKEEIEMKTHISTKIIEAVPAIRKGVRVLRGGPTNPQEHGPRGGGL